MMLMMDEHPEPRVSSTPSPFSRDERPNKKTIPIITTIINIIGIKFYLIVN